MDVQSTSWLPQYTPEQLWEKQVADQDLGKLTVWLEDKVTPTTQDLYQQSGSQEILAQQESANLQE